MSFRIPIPVAFLTAVAAGALAVLFGFPTVSPEIGDLVAAGAGIRPPVDVLPGFVRGVFAAFFALLSPADAMAAVTVSGRLLVFAAAYLAFKVIDESTIGWLDFAFGPTSRSKLVKVVVPVTATLVFVLNDPVWYALVTMTPTGCQLVWTLFGVLAMMRLQGLRLRLYRFDAAEAYAKAALPESAAADRRNVNRTLEAIRKAREPKKVR